MFFLTREQKTLQTQQNTKRMAGTASTASTVALKDVIFTAGTDSLDAVNPTDTKDVKTEQKHQMRMVGLVHIRNQARSGKKSITTIEGLTVNEGDELDLKKISRFLKKKFATNCAVVDSEEFGKIIQLQGDLRHQAADFLVEHNICERSLIKIHGA